MDQHQGVLAGRVGNTAGHRQGSGAELCQDLLGGKPADAATVEHGSHLRDGDVLSHFRQWGQLQQIPQQGFIARGAQRQHLGIIAAELLAEAIGVTLRVHA